MMSHCQHHIIANSTYSRRSAYLGDPTGTTIAPRMWLSDVSSEQVVPETWMRV
jgi:hypothetical protein